VYEEGLKMCNTYPYHISFKTIQLQTLSKIRLPDYISSLNFNVIYTSKQINTLLIYLERSFRSVSGYGNYRSEQGHEMKKHSDCNIKWEANPTRILTAICNSDHNYYLAHCPLS
jgi:hypothetical protein